ncbi:MAG: D-isomer specific 2-hydroxyacid dehydrogenase NAD-binding, glyoxylate reductase [Microgenomates group bacterium GW2011_GWC1_41_20]|uniref:D-isomer specific 2-hydroxyacid dehydrogenase NAD-binding protein n=7 Tax=Candidatus Woeseibacteriota TaxID=1752722 RepID=A0A0G0RTF4_9BACT|nr:MAG: D-isomer specific 2-hydroxyacid dehydrogenase NAD-binding protein [Candidatus Woesebacteria bacterium GW2011_GWB1_40_12]KKR55974.1 MAG: D-isomer specific 2-hydroxyacid dehydrogenase NAD-binding protein [Candidatus Woesebacteria bacterium GW2011_GWF1_40_24]KKR90930.1 MAG: D-isomer specific 2-hydroxyacid dehydrogenase NAD-binding protein [Candidatus Woesebacteria bacterium GW2011_GWD1_41_12]KKR99441.1 MAG: D-isomer specific 2-hydroxyacid dehydrogenase NAD-binding, glyoxylate reductase [Mic
MKVFVTRKIPGDHLEKLKSEGFEVHVSDDNRILTNEELLAGITGADAVLSLLTDKIDGDVMDAAGPQLKLISNYAVGFDNIDVAEAAKRGIIVCNTPSDEVNEAVAEHTWALILALARRVVEADEATRRGAYKGWEPDVFLGTNLIGKTLGIVGLGRIGSMVARRAAGYKMNVLYNKRAPDPEAERELGVKFVTLDELLSSSDFISLHVPLTPETRHMINKDTFAKMKKGSYLINTARGQIVDERDLVDALASAQIAGAALDVFDNEPNISPELIANQKVITTPHIASATWEARNKMGEQAVSAIIDTLKNVKPQNMVDEKVWDIRRK